MREPRWVAMDVVLAVHAALLCRFGGSAGVRDEGLLASALHRPLQSRAYGGPTLFDLAAAYAAGIVRNHPFVDGNKRTGFMVAYIFLEANGLCFAAPEEEVAVQTLALAAGELDEAGYAAWLATSCGPTPESRRPVRRRFEKR